jgi:cytochrome c oxidase subunit III
VAITVAFLAFLAAIAAWWLAQQRLTSKPWLEEGEGPVARAPLPGTSPVAAAKVGLGVLLAVVGSLFALFASAYMMRMHMAADWRPLPEPKLLWLNTGVLALSSLALHRAQVAARRGQPDATRAALLAGGVGAAAFLVGQLLAWQELSAAGYFVASNPANSFFYVITAVHGLHLLGGLVALGRTIAEVWGGAEPDQVRLHVELCAAYWHFLLLVWLAFFALLLLT